MHNKYGCLKPSKDMRDYKLAKVSCATPLPTVFKLTQLPKVKNQGSVSSCVAHSTSSILEYHDMLDGNNNTLSTNFIYGIQKKLCGHTGSGMYLRDACKIVKEYGDMLETDCPGNTEVPKAHKIAEEAITDENKISTAKHFKIDSYVSLSKNDEIKRAIMNYGPVLASIKWYDTFECGKDYVLQGEQKGEYGYHAILLFGWCEKGFLAQNSWGTKWGDSGRFVLPYEIPVRQAWQMIDADTEDIVKPKRNKYLDILYNILNYIINFFNKFS